MRVQFTNDLKEAMKAGDRKRVDAIRLITAALKDRDIAARGEGKTVSDEDILAPAAEDDQKPAGIAGNLREEQPAGARRAGEGRDRGDSSYLPKQMDECAVAEAIKAAIAETGAASMKDMGKVIGVLKGKYTGQMDFAKASAAVKAALSGWRLASRAPPAAVQVEGADRGERHAHDQTQFPAFERFVFGLRVGEAGLAAIALAGAGRIGRIREIQKAIGEDRQPADQRKSGGAGASCPEGSEVHPVIPENRALPSASEGVRLGGEGAGMDVLHIGGGGFTHRLADLGIASVVLERGFSEAEHVDDHQHLPIRHSTRADADRRR